MRFQKMISYRVHVTKVKLKSRWTIAHRNNSMKLNLSIFTDIPRIKGYRKMSKWNNYVSELLGSDKFHNIEQRSRFC